jgi:hypothetical protein
MSSGSLFDAETNSGSGRKTFLIAFLAFVILAGSGYTLYWYSKPADRDPDDILAEEIRDSTVIMLAQPRFTGEEFREQVLGKARLVKFVRSLKDAYFVYPETDEQEFATFRAKYFKDPGKIEFATKDGSTLSLGGYNIPISPESFRFFRTSLDNIRIDPNLDLSFKLKDAVYNVTLGELRNFVNNSMLYGGNLIARVPERTDKPIFVFGNHATMVAKPNEPSLVRLTERLLQGVGNDREARIQRLVDFVSNDIEYSYAEALGTSETLKRPSETLMTRNGDCSNKTILLASLLEQIGEEYILLYCPNHITVAVPQGAFPNETSSISPGITSCG